LKSDGKQLQKFADWYLGQASIASRDVPIEKIGANTEFKLSFTSPSIEELASSFRTDGHQSSTLILMRKVQTQPAKLRQISCDVIHVTATEIND